MSKAEDIKYINETIKHFNKKGIWLFKGLDIKKHILKNFGKELDSNFVNNCLKHLLSKDRLFKSKTSSKYFGLLEAVYFSPYDHLNTILKTDIKISNMVVKLFNNMQNLNKSINMEIFNKESLFTTMIEYSTLNENNLDKRSDDIFDLEIIEKTNIENLYKLFSDKGIKNFIDINFLKNVHSRLTSGISGTKRMHGASGEFTNEQNYIAGGYLPCEITNKLDELNRFIVFYNERPNDLNDAFIRLAIISYWFAGIHIFEDANSRTGRFLISYYLYLHGYSKKLSFAISKALYKIGGKEIFVGYQGKAWIEKDVEVYIRWFIEELINESWFIQTRKYFE